MADFCRRACCPTPGPLAKKEVVMVSKPGQSCSMRISGTRSDLEGHQASCRIWRNQRLREQASCRAERSVSFSKASWRLQSLPAGDGEQLTTSVHRLYGASPSVSRPIVLRSSGLLERHTQKWIIPYTRARCTGSRHGPCVAQITPRGGSHRRSRSRGTSQQANVAGVSTGPKEKSHEFRARGGPVGLKDPLTCRVGGDRTVAGAAR